MLAARGAAADGGGGRRRITLANISEKETFRYSLPIVRGFVAGHPRHPVRRGTILLKRLDGNGSPEGATAWPVVDGAFRCLADLNPGRNRFVLECESARLCLDLEFLPKTTAYHVLPVYVICSGSDGRFQAPEREDNSPQSACRRIALGARLIQSLTAEKLSEGDVGRRTFRLARDFDGDGAGAGAGAECVLFRSRLRAQEMYRMRPEEMWQHLARELVSSAYGCERRKFLAFLSCTRYSADAVPRTHEEVVAHARGHVALGGGGLAVFGTGCLHTWPETVDQVPTRFADETAVDKLKFMDDSCYRGTYGGCFSTTLGAVCHELGHAFDLGHSRTGIMGRGFDNVNLVFVAAEDGTRTGRGRGGGAGGQHATVCFTRDLSVTCTFPSPARRTRGHLHRTQRGSPQRRIAAEPKVVATWNPRCWAAEKEPPPVNGRLQADDLTFWARSCAVLLGYHRWFADEEAAQDKVSCIEFDSDRYIVHSPAGIRVIELRGDDGLVLHSWEFVSAYIPKQFMLPMEKVGGKNVAAVVAEDSDGNILKHRFNGG